MKLAYVERVLGTISETNRGPVRGYVRARLAEGLRPTSLRNMAVALRQLDRDHGGKPLADMTAADLTKSLLDYTATHAAASATSWAAVVRSYYRHLHAGELPGGAPPPRLH